jgi:hypothetical protein
MKVPIPNDWSGENWHCLQVQWPDSPQWTGLLTGILTLLTRGRYWDENTGTITEAQAIAWQIFNLAYPFVSCDGSELPPTDPDDIQKVISWFGGDGCDESEENMGACGYNPNAFKIEGGKFYVRDFCGEWVEIGEMASPAEDPPEDIYDDMDPQPDFYACGKISFMIDQFVLLSDAAWESYSSPTTMEAYMRGAVTEAVNLERFRIYQWFAQLVVLEAAMGPGYFNNENMVETAKCLAMGAVEANGQGTDAEVEAVVTALGQACQQQWGTIPELYWFAYWDFVRHTFGQKDCRLLLSLGATDEVECDCPGTGGEYGGVLKFADTFDCAEPSQIELLVGGQGRYVDVTWNAPSGAFVGNANLEIDMTGGVDIEDVTFLVTPLGASNMPPDEWVSETNCPERDPEIWDFITIGTVTDRSDDKTILSGSYKMEHVWSTPKTVSLCYSGPRKCGGADDTPAETYNYRIEIIKLNGEDYGY